MSNPSPESPFWKAVNGTYRSARMIVVAIVGASVVLVGVAMLVLPGPAFIVIPTGLAILGLEFAWARRWLRRIKRRAQQGVDRLRAVKRMPKAEPTPGAPLHSQTAPTPPIQTPRNSRT